MIPRRIRRSRTKGARLPENTVCVTRPGQYSNPYRIGTPPACACRSAGECTHGQFYCDTPAEAVAEYKAIPRSDRRLAQIRHDLRGKNLACWCRLCPAHSEGKPLGVVCTACAPCHADVLLELANAPEATP